MYYCRPKTCIIAFFSSDKPGKPSSLQRLLNAITGEEGKPTLSKIIQVSSLPEQYLSPLIINFRPKTASNLNLLSQEYIRKISCIWLENVDKLLRMELTKILLLIDDIKRLHKIIKEEVFEVEYPSNWEEIGDSLLGTNKLNIYHRFIKDYVTNRIRELIQSMWQNSLNTILIYLHEIDEDALKDK